MRPSHILPLVLCIASLGGLACGANSTEPSLPSGDVSIVPNASTRGSAAFTPNPFSESLASSATVVWVNGDRVSSGYGGMSGTTHHLVSDTGLFDSAALAPGSKFTFTFAGSGTYKYHCSIHAAMVGTITITP